MCKPCFWIEIAFLCLLLSSPYVHTQADIAPFPQPTRPVQAAAAEIRITAKGFEPATVTIAAGQEVAWVNDTDHTHILSSGRPWRSYLPLVMRDQGARAANSPQSERTGDARAENEVPSFQATLAPEQTFSYTFDSGGEWPFYLRTAPQFSGAVRVEGTELPPDPGSVAPAADGGVATTVISGTAFLYSGDDPIQTGVLLGTIEGKRVAVLRGRVSTRDGAPLSGVRVSILNHPEYGQTFSRANGAYDMAVNGGARLVVTFRKVGYLDVQRHVEAPWQDYVPLPDVTMITRDPRVTEVNMDTGDMQVAQGSRVSDGDGSRQTTLLIPEGTEAGIVQPDGTTQPAVALHIRATEFTVGDSGPQAMPGELPPVTGYTYAVELTADEAVAKVEGKDITFSQPVIFYQENFLGFPTGGAVPLGYYDPDAAAWVPYDNGRVIEILCIVDGRAQLDTTGDGLADNGAALAVTTAERTRLAGLYDSGQSLWRMPLTHFSLWDANWGVGPDPDAAPPSIAQPLIDFLQDPLCTIGLCKLLGSMIGTQNQTLGESIPLTGVPYSLHYQSERTPGYRAAYTADIPVSEKSVPASLKWIKVKVEIAGRTYTATLPAAANQSYPLAWDGKDAYGRTVQGSQPATVRVAHVYDGYYQEPAEIERAFGYRGNGTPFTYDTARQAFKLYQEWEMRLGAWDGRGFGLGGWSLSVHHAYDPASQILYLGDGGQRRAGTESHTINTLAGGGTDATCSTCPADALRMDRPHGLAVAEDGSLYIADTFSDRVRVVRPEGTAETVTALNGRLYRPMDVAWAAAGALYVADAGTQYQPGHNRVIRLDLDGTIVRIAGTGAYGYNGDGIPATTAQLASPAGVVLGPEGSVYIADTGNHRIRQIGPDGTIQTIAGTGSGGFSGDGGPATAAQIRSPHGLAAAADGSIYFADYGNRRVRRITPEGTIETVSPDLGLWTTDVALDGEDNLYVTAGGASLEDLYKVYRIAPDGEITAVAGNGTAGFSGDGGPAGAAQVAAWVYGVASGHDGALYLAGNDRVRQVSSPLPGFGYGDLAIPSADGTALYQFDPYGRHLRTADALTGVTLFEFIYNAQGRLTGIQDVDGDLTAIQRSGGITPTAIVAPFGQTTALQVDDAGYLQRVTDPEGQAVHCTYTSGGLLQGLIDRRSHTTSYRYDAKGRLIEEEDPAGGSLALSRAESGAAYTVTVNAAGELTTSYGLGFDEGGRQWRRNTFPDGTESWTTVSPDASLQVTLADGMQRARQLGPDPRFGMQAPLLAEQQTHTPGGRTATVTATRAAAWSSPSNPLSLIALTDTLAFNGRAYRASYQAGARRWTYISPEGRQVVDTLDEQGRVIEIEAAGVAQIALDYDGHGRLHELVQGTRQTLWAYDSGTGYLWRRTDAMGAATTYERDAIGRLVHLTTPQGHTWRYEWDGNGNLTGLTEPDGTAQHEIEYTEDDRIARYRSPMGAEETFTYDPQGRARSRSFPSGDALEWDYNRQGQLAALRTPQGDHTFAYHPASGLLAQATSRDGQTIALGYDGELLTSAAWSGPVAGTIGYMYDHDLRLSRVDYAGSSLALGYDEDGLLVSVGGIALTRGADTGEVRALSDGAFQVAYAYTPYGEVGEIAASHGGALYRAVLTYDDLGRAVEKAETIGGSTTTWTYGYDEIGQLLWVRRNGTTVEAYAYDAAGNRTAMTNALTGVTLPAGSYVYDGDHKLLQAGSTAFTYDGDGRLRTATAGGQTATYSYHADSTLAAVTAGGQTIAYEVDAYGRRVTRNVDGAVTHRWLYGSGRTPLAEYDGDGDLRTRYIYAGEETPVRMVRGGTTYHIVSDLLGSPRLVADGGGSVVKRIDYDAYGNVIADSNPGFDLPFGFAGGRADPAHELVRFGARDYQPSTGRWTDRDPILLAGGAHLYRYVGNDPVNAVDRAGLQLTQEEMEHAIRNIDQVAFEDENFFLAGLKLKPTQKGQRIFEENDYEADRYAFQYVTKHGYYDPRGLEIFLTTIGHIEDLSDPRRANQGRTLFLYKHPPTETRLDLLKHFYQESQNSPEGCRPKEFHTHRYRQLYRAIGRWDEMQGY